MSKKPETLSVARPGGTTEDEAELSVAPVEPKKKTRTESPERIALRWHQENREILEKTTAEVKRHAKRIGELNAEIKSHQAARDALSQEAKAILEKLVGSP